MNGNFDERIYLLLLVVVTLVLVSSEASGQDSATETQVDFERHVAPLLGRYGCNAASCHGAFDGKGGMQFSLFGYSAELDYQNLEPRVDPDDPDESSLLLKPSGGEEHGGGALFDRDSASYGMIRKWIAQGAQWTPGSGKVRRLRVTPSQLVFQTAKPDQLNVVAEFQDGTQQNVTHLAQFSSRDEGIAQVSPTGQVFAKRSGSTHLIVTYGNQFGAVPVLKPFPRIAGSKASLAGPPPQLLD